MTIECSVTPHDKLDKVNLMVKNGNVKEEKTVTVVGMDDERLRVKIESELREMKAKVTRRVLFYNRVFTIGREAATTIKLEK